MNRSQLWGIGKKFIAGIMITAALAVVGCAGRVPLAINIWQPDGEKEVVGLRMNLPLGRDASVSGLDAGVYNEVALLSYALQIGVIGNNVEQDLENAIQAAGLINIANKNMSGAQLAIIANVTEEDAKGFQIGGIWNRSGGNMAGFQAGGISLVYNDMRGVQIGGLTRVAGDTTGVQIGGLGSLAGDMTGVQIGGVFCLAEDVTGLQASTSLNFARKNRGLQFSVVNIPLLYASQHAFNLTSLLLLGNFAETSSGVQMSVVNTAFISRGLQIGLLNIAELDGGLQIGLLNIGANGILPIFPFINYGRR